METGCTSWNDSLRASSPRWPTKIVRFERPRNRLPVKIGLFDGWRLNFWPFDDWQLTPLRRSHSKTTLVLTDLLVRSRKSFWVVATVRYKPNIYHITLRRKWDGLAVNTREYSYELFGPLFSETPTHVSSCCSTWAAFGLQFGWGSTRHYPMASILNSQTPSNHRNSSLSLICRGPGYIYVRFRVSLWVILKPLPGYPW